MGRYRISGAGKAITGIVTGTAALVGGGYMLLASLANTPETATETASTAGVQHVTQPAPRPVQAQVNTMWGIRQGGRMYALWDGYVVEDNENNTGYLPSDNSFDKNIYDFDLGVIIHATGYVRGAAPGSLNRTLFNELAVNGQLPPHIENVRKIGCELVGIFEERHRSGAYGPPPGDVLTYKERHCTPPVAPAAATPR